MDLKGFTETQRQALLDLLVLAMYMDGNLASSEEKRVEEVLTAMGFGTEYDRDRAFDASVTRVRQQAQTPDNARACAGKLAANFVTPDQRRRVYDLLSQLTSMDGSVSADESKFLSVIRDLYRL